MKKEEDLLYLCVFSESSRDSGCYPNTLLELEDQTWELSFSTDCIKTDLQGAILCVTRRTISTGAILCVTRRTRQKKAQCDDRFDFFILSFWIYFGSNPIESSILESS